MRLIDADALIEQIKTDINNTYYFMEQVEEDSVLFDQFYRQLQVLQNYKAIIENLPKAYDVGKVVAELEKEKAKSIYDSDGVIDVKSAYSKAIDIVKAGGKDE